MKFIIILFKIFALLWLVRKVRCQCTIDIRTDLNRSSLGTPYREPIFLKFIDNEYKLMVPTNGELIFRENENAVISCTSDGRPNSLKFNGKKSSTIICSSGKKFNINNKLHSISDFNECANAITGSVFNNNRVCGSGDGISMMIGFNDERGFVNLIDVCYSKKRGSSIYTSHTIPGKTIKNAMKASSRPSSFKTTELPPNISAASSFTQRKQLERFAQIFGSSDKTEEYLNVTFLGRGHLSPDADMIFFSWQWATYYYINVVPQFQSINNGNWKHIESAVRSKAAMLKRDLLVLTGGSVEVLKLNNKKITLESDGLEVPKWTWKIIKDKESNAGIVFVTLNNPFANSATNLCSDVCLENGWDWKERKTYSKGYTICCKIDDFLTVMKGVPNHVRTNNVLQK